MFDNKHPPVIKSPPDKQNGETIDAKILAIEKRLGKLRAEISTLIGDVRKIRTNN